MNWEQLKKEVNFRADRSSGSGGQHVNKVATKVTLQFYPVYSRALSEKEKELIFSKLSKKLSKEGALIVSEQGFRSQIRNKKYAFLKLENILLKAIEPPKGPRKRIKKKRNTAASRKASARLSEKKANRKKVNIYQS